MSAQQERAQFGSGNGAHDFVATGGERPSVIAHATRHKHATRHRPVDKRQAQLTTTGPLAAASAYNYRGRLFTAGWEEEGRRK